MMTEAEVKQLLVDYRSRIGRAFLINIWIAQPIICRKIQCIAASGVYRKAL